MHPHTHHPRRNRRGAILIYAIVSMTAMFGFISLAVDYGRAQLTRTELQRSADATARGCMALYKVYGSATAQGGGPILAAVNPVDSGARINPTVNITWGRWNDASDTFVAGGGSPVAVRVIISRTAARGNALPLTFGAIVGVRSVDVSATAIAVFYPPTSTTITVPATSDPWLSGMPNGAKASYNDRAPAQSPQAIAVTAGQVITFESISGSVNHCGTGGSFDSATGSTSEGNYMHNADAPGGPGPAAENGIADVLMPINSLLGVFLTDARPDLTAAPSRRDYSTTSSREKPVFDDILNKQPFYIGNGVTPSGTVQQFKVPPGATRVFLGPMDGYEWSNNRGSFQVTIKSPGRIALVQ